MIRVFLVDDHKIVREGLKLILQDCEDILVVGESESAEEALEKMTELKPDVAIVDITMHRMNGIEMTGILHQKNPEINVIIFSMHESEEYILESIKNNAKAYILKDSPSEEIIKGIRKVAEGEKFYSNSASVLLADAYAHKINAKETAQNPFSKRENQVLEMLKNGNSNKDVAQKLNLSLRTVEVHRFNMMKKVNAKNLVELLNIAQEEGWFK